jgi:hypothetical protein
MSGEFVAAAWLSPRPMPRLYPNLVTLDGADRQGAHLAAIRRLKDSLPSGNWAVKDSFAVLEPAPLGFRLLFEARWIHRAADPLGAIGGAQPVTDEHALASWELAWNGGTHAARVFPPALLQERDHAVLAIWRNGAIVAGCIASRCDGVLGISNPFAPADDEEAHRACLAAAMQFAPGLPLVGYEQGEGLARMKQLGFAEIGPLRVWQAVV